MSRFKNIILGGGNKSGPVENFSKLSKWKGGMIIRYLGVINILAVFYHNVARFVLSPSGNQRIKFKS